MSEQSIPFGRITRIDIRSGLVGIEANWTVPVVRLDYFIPFTDTGLTCIQLVMSWN